MESAEDENTLAWNKKRGRRVSFAAEMTSVHVFDRDDDVQTPPDDKEEKKAEEAKFDADDVLAFFNDLGDDDNVCNDDSIPREPFLQPFESPGSASALGSATSNDDNDFFGPVSSEFIRAGRLSDSVASDDNHEVTMDSTAFSMNFRSLATSDSRYLKTPTGSPFVFEEKTPTQSGTATMQGSSMELTRYDKPAPQISIPVDKFSSGKDSNDMSLLEDNPRKYDYATISPRLDELMSVGNKLIRIPADFSNGINDTNYSRNTSSATGIQNGRNSSKDVQAADLGNPSVHASATAYERFREELSASSHSLIQSGENKSQSSGQHNTATEITEDMASYHVEAQPGIRCCKLSDLSSSAPSFVQPTQKEHSNFNFQGGLLKRSKTTSKRDSSDHKCEPNSPVILYPSTSVEIFEDNPGESRHISDTAQRITVQSQSPSVAVTSLVGGLKGQLALGVSNTAGLTDLLPSEKSEGSLLNKSGTNTNLRYSSVKKNLPTLKLNGVASLSPTPVAGDSSIRSKLSSCIVKTPQRDLPVSRLEDQFLGVDQGPNVQKMTEDSVGDGFMSSEKLGGSLLNQAGIDSDVRYSSKRKIVSILERDGVSSFSVTPLVEVSSIRSKLSGCIVKSPHHGMLVSRLEEQFLATGLELSEQKRITDVDEKSSAPSLILNGHSHKKISRAPTCMMLGMSPHHHHSSPDELHGSPHGLNLDIVQIDSAITESTPLKIWHHNTDKLDNTIEKVIPSFKSSKLKSPSRSDRSLHLKLDQQNHADKSIKISPENYGHLMELVSNGGDSNVVAQQLDDMLISQMYPRSPLIFVDQQRSPLLANSLLSGNSNSLFGDGCLQTPLKTGAVISPYGNIDLSDVCFSHHASADKPPVTVQNAIEESSPSAFVQYVSHLKAPEPSVHKRGHNQIDAGTEHSTLNVDKSRSPKVSRKEFNESVRINYCHDDDQSRCGSVGAPKHWPTTFSRAQAGLERSCEVSFDRLDVQKIELLEDVLIQLQKVHHVSGICDSIQTQSLGNHYNMERNRRISETKELLQKMLYEQAKLKLIHAKREKLLQRKEIVRSGIQRCHAVKLNCSQLHAHFKCNAIDTESLTARLEDRQNVQTAHQEILKMRQKIDATQREIDSLMYSFKTCFKMKEKSTNVDTISLINDHLKRRAVFMSLQKDVQLWEIDGLFYEKGQNKLSLNYQGYLIQRFTLVAPTSTVTVSWMLNYSSIEKKYPNMDAHIAFSFAFREDVEQKYVGMRNMAQQTQATSSVISNLLDVIEEVKSARLELKHLVEARFVSPSAGKLDLCLHFVDFKTGMKINTTLDVSCLSCGVYPSDAFPFQLQSCPVTTDLLPAGLQASVENLKHGFSRILRMCRSVSKVLTSRA